MNNLKEFWDLAENFGDYGLVVELRKRQGMFFWDKIKEWIFGTVKAWEDDPNHYFCSLWDFIINQKDYNSIDEGYTFDYCTDCLGEVQVNEMLNGVLKNEIEKRMVAKNVP